MDESSGPGRTRLQRSPDGGSPARDLSRRAPGRLVASWQRSQDYGVSPDTVEPTFAGTWDDTSLFFQCGLEVLTELHRSLGGEPVSLMLTDPGGLVLNRLSGDHALLRTLDAVHLAPGFAYSEREAGTNGVGLALADRVATLVRAEEHYATSLCGYTCAAVPVSDPVTGRLEGSINLTTWADTGGGLLLALAQSAAGNTQALMLNRSLGRAPRRAPRGEVFRVEPSRLEPGSGRLTSLSTAWTAALEVATGALVQHKVVAAVGEPGSGRTTVLAQALRAARPRGRILAASPPDPADVDAWLELWTPELAKPDTTVVVRDVDALPTWVADRLRDLFVRARSGSAGGGAGGLVLGVTSEGFEAIPESLASLVETVVAVPPLRERPDDILPLAHHAAIGVRGREIHVTRAAEHALTTFAWPGNVRQLQDVVKEAARRSDVIDVAQLPAAVLSGGTRRLSRIETFERDEIVRALTRPGISMREAATELGMSRATLYRKVAHYGVRLDHRARL